MGLLPWPGKSSAINAFDEDLVTGREKSAAVNGSHTAAVSVKPWTASTVAPSEDAFVFSCTVTLTGAVPRPSRQH